MATLQTGMSTEEEDPGKQLSIDTQPPQLDPMPSTSPSDYSASSSPIFQSSKNPSKPAALLTTPITAHPLNYPQPSPPPLQPLPNLPSIDAVQAVHSRGLSLASSSSSVKRKPLPSQAKPLALRYSTDYESSRGSFETPGPRFNRNPSIDRATLYEAGLFPKEEASASRQRSPT